MSSSRRAKRMARHHQRNKASSLNLVALMDIFTVLVLFILMSSSNSYQLPSTQDLKLPNSRSDNPPQETLVIAVTQQDILFEGQRVASIADVLEDKENALDKLRDELNYFKSKSQDPAEAKRITLMSDADAPYAVLKKILSVCQSQQYTQVALAAMQEEKSIQ